jgi:hypothetical protein
MNQNGIMENKIIVFFLLHLIHDPEQIHEFRGALHFRNVYTSGWPLADFSGIKVE